MFDRYYQKKKKLTAKELPTMANYILQTELYNIEMNFRDKNDTSGGHSTQVIETNVQYFPKTQDQM